MESQTRSSVLQWLSAFAISTAINLPRALNRRHHVSSKTSVHVFAAVITILAFALVIRLVFFIAVLLRRRFAQAGRA